MKRLELLDYGRFIAALAVMAFHYLFNGIQNGKLSSLTHIAGLVDIAKYGQFGVEFFFMISGYVIFFSARGKTPGEFGVSRAVRLYPAFWVAVVFTTIIAQFWGGRQMSVGIFQAIANLTMLPGLFGQGYVDGVYWTLQLELSFYALVLVILFFGLQPKLESLFILWPLVMLIAKLTNLSHLPFAGRHYSYFAAGVIFAILKNRRDMLVICSMLVSLALCIGFSAGNASMLTAAKGVPFSKIIIGTIIIVQFGFFIILNSSRGSVIALPGSRLVGSLTYPVYLIHAHFGYMFLSRFGTDETRLQAYIATILMVFCLSFLIHTYVEKRFSKVWYKLFWVALGSPIDTLARRLRELMPVFQR